MVAEGKFSRLLNITFAIGDIWMLIAAAMFAVYSILLKNKPKKLGSLLFQSSTFTLEVLFLLPFFIFEHTKTPSIEIGTKIVLSIMYLAIFASLAAFFLWNRAVEIFGPSRAGMIY